MINMTFGQLQWACTINDYILVRIGEHVTAVNCKAQMIRFAKHPVDKTLLSNVWSFKPISFHEYISRKLPIGTKTKPFIIYKHV